MIEKTVTAQISTAEKALEETRRALAEALWAIDPNETAKKVVRVVGLANNILESLLIEGGK